MSEGGKKGSRQKQHLYIGEITVSGETSPFSATAVKDYNTAPKPHPYTSHSANQILSVDNAKLSFALRWITVYQCDILTAWQE